ncbi:hypothetical protein Mapa_007765 [Marchantia paleacea]|nr:hypothetical protein Mapa_007765 [Marchantia paleacea]
MYHKMPSVVSAKGRDIYCLPGGHDDPEILRSYIVEFDAKLQWFIVTCVISWAPGWSKGTFPPLFCSRKKS